MEVFMKTLTIVKSERDNVKVWGAIIIGLNQKYGFEREFKSYRYLNNCSSKHAYYDYYINVEEGQFVETRETGAYKRRGNYYQLKNGEFISISPDEISNFFRKENEKIS